MSHIMNNEQQPMNFDILLGVADGEYVTIIFTTRPFVNDLAR